LVPIVAIGASAGGLEAICELLAALPSQSGMAYVLVQHLDPAHESLLPEILAKKTAMPVIQIRDDLSVEAGHVYVIPPNAVLTLSDGRFRLTRRKRGGGQHLPIDTFFASVADTRGAAAIGVVLSGGHSDGALGLQAIKQGGGLTFAQTPESARFPSMPQNAIATGCVDFVLDPKRIAEELVSFGLRPLPGSLVLPSLATSPSPSHLEPHTLGADPSLVGPRLADLPLEIQAAGDEEMLKRVFRVLRTAHGVDFTLYKRSTLRRRLSRRVAVRKADTLSDYLTVLEAEPAEAAALYHDFLIQVTGFFRDPEAFEGLSGRVFPRICEGRSTKIPIRIWVPGCASGEEVYSIAIALVEYLGERLLPAGVQIFGTDVNEAAIETARAGVFAESLLQEVSAERRARFFVRQDDQYVIAKRIRDLCIFARQDVTRDPPFSRLDLVSCRNLLIYLDSSAQRRVMHIFHYALRPQGFLMLGPSETIGQAADLFELADTHHRLYTRKGGLPGVGLDLPQQGARVEGPARDVGSGVDLGFIEADSVQREADRVLLARYAPASLLVDEALNILQFRGETGPYLEHASGPPSLNLHRVARPELLVEIAPAVAEARKSGSGVRREGLRVNDLLDVSIEVIPLPRTSSEPCYLILFDDGTHRANRRRERQTDLTALPETEKDRRLAQLGREITATRDYLHAIMQEHEAVKEELKSAHEEVLSANEEFQSTNEELETAKEELQSANEELTTTNDELGSRNRELSVVNAELQKAREVSDHARAYADVIVESVREPLLVLDGKLRILRANNAFYANTETRREDIEGRLLYEIGAGQWNIPVLRTRLQAVLTRNETMDEYEITQSFPISGERKISLNARKIRGGDERAELILLAMEDVTERRAAAGILREDTRRKDEFLAMLAHELRNPLTPITHAIRLLRRTDVDAPSVKLHAMIERQTLRLGRLVDELLDVARISRGQIELTRESVDLGVIAQHAADASRARIEERKHLLTLTRPDTPVWVEGDPIRLEQIVSNLIENAAKYTEPGGRIVVQLAQAAGEATLSVRDNGIGLAPESLEIIFELFTQVDSSLARSGGGLGIGLNLVRRVLELHAGRVEARSAGLGQGTEMIVRLPLQVPEPTVAKAVAQIDKRAAPASGSARRVLIVEDNVDSAESMALLARSWGHEVVIAGDGSTALTLAQSFQPHAAVVDIGLPGMDGYALARRLRQNSLHRELYLVAMTGYGREEDRRAARAAGFDSHIVKPADMDELEKLLAVGGAKRSGT
jgi:two-component system CheB/CheR fusion protein